MDKPTGYCVIPNYKIIKVCPPGLIESIPLGLKPLDPKESIETLKNLIALGTGNLKEETQTNGH